MVFLTTLLVLTGCSSRPKELDNAVGMHFMLVQPGHFEMGNTHAINAERLGGPSYLGHGDWDEHPVHKVTISSPYYISTTEVTIKQFQKFRPAYKGNKKYAPYASGISWDGAVAYCKWLSKKEGKTYRLPTEAEWAYAARAGRNTLFASSDSLPKSGEPNAWGLKNMNTDVAEWCWDWHGDYPAHVVTDPVGPAHGWARVVRGGGLDRPECLLCPDGQPGRNAAGFSTHPD